MCLLKFLGTLIRPVSLHRVIVAFGNVVSALIALSAETSRVMGPGPVLALPGKDTLATTVEVALVAHEGRLVLPGVVLTMFYHVEICHDLLNLE